ncbi:Holliday junction branch migration protein RuvA [Candidatus Peregrinibacteria bacterium]|nr:Holliday junction branch migration protein RuvA [Candidatus Peregrinibacteria bacterium]
MIAYLQGKILKKEPKGIILQSGDIGYFVHQTALSLSELEENQEIALFIHHNIKEEHWDFFGFQKYEDLHFFKLLITISGIGPKLALDILSAPQHQVKAAILNQDDLFLSKIPGIGKKTAARIIIELKDKITLDNERAPYKKLNEAHPDALDALQKLGYHRRDIEKILHNLPQEISEIEDIITYFLKNA